MLKHIISFGFKFRRPTLTPGVAVLDVRGSFRNPHHQLTLRDKDGHDPAVQDYIRATPEFQAKYDYLKVGCVVPGIETVYIGCTGGRHRSVFLAEKLAQELGVTVSHRDVGKK